MVRAMASSVDLLDRYANCIGSRVGDSEEQMKDLTSLSKHFNYDRGQCYRAIVIHADVLGHRDDGGPFEAGGEYRQAEGEVEDVAEDPC